MGEEGISEARRAGRGVSIKIPQFTASAHLKIPLYVRLVILFMNIEPELYSYVIQASIDDFD